MEVILAKHAGFCFGVQRAVDTVYEQIEKRGKEGRPIYTYGPIIHNEEVVGDLQKRGVCVLDSLADAGAVPREERGTVIIRSHGVEKIVCERLRELGYDVVDATCPFVLKIHRIVEQYSREGCHVVIIGNSSHPEVEGTVGQVDQLVEVVESAEQVENLQLKNPEKVAYVSQTTISCDDSKVVINALKRKYPRVLEPKKADICYATQNRQDAVKELAKRSDLILVVGSKTSSNSNRLREVAEGVGTKAYLLDDASEIDPIWLKGIESIGITAGASAPEILVEEIIERLKEFEPCEVIAMEGVEENVEFPLPKGLWKKDLEEAKSQNKA